MDLEFQGSQWLSQQNILWLVIRQFLMPVQFLLALLVRWCCEFYYRPFISVVTRTKLNFFFFKCYINVSGLYHQKHILVKKQTLEPECLGSDLNSIQVNLPALVSSSLKEGLIVPTYLWMWSWTIKKAECWRIDAFFFFNWCFWTVVLEKTLESPLDCRESQPVYPKGNRSWIIGRTDAEAEIPILWPPDVKN